jgi:hypothetical protein
VRPYNCAACSTIATVGGHVVKVASLDTHWYIIPLCERCNAWPGELEVYETTRLISANVGGTCGW